MGCENCYRDLKRNEREKTIYEPIHNRGGGDQNRRKQSIQKRNSCPFKTILVLVNRQAIIRFFVFFFLLPAQVPSAEDRFDGGFQVANGA